MKKKEGKFDENIHMDQLNKLREVRDGKIDHNKLRLTIINGINCEFV
tara:strand:- start:253 stop:393 length:141 start_codon:yes stop_codon:yes gene_type:complete